MLPEQLKPFIEQARAIHQRTPVVVPYLELYGYESIFAPGGGPQCDLEKLDQANVRAFGIALTGGPPYFQIGPDEFKIIGSDEDSRRRVMNGFAAAMKLVAQCPRVRFVKTAADLLPPPTVAGEEPPFAVLPLACTHRHITKLSVLDDLFALGMRISHPANSFCNTWCRSYPAYITNCRAAPIMTEFGREIIAKMNELGIVIDVAHMSDESTLAIAQSSRKPIIDGHTGSRTIIPWGRGHADAALKIIADSGGVAGIHFADHLYTPKVYGTKYPYNDLSRQGASGTEPRLWKYNRHLLATVSDYAELVRLRRNTEAQEAFYVANNLPPEPALPQATDRLATVADMADHIEHMVNVMGIEHVGLGGDVNGIASHMWPIGCDHVGELPHLTAELLRRGWQEKDLEKFLSANWLRVYHDCLPA